MSGLSKGYLVPGWRTGWLVVGGGDRLKEVLGAVTKLAEGRLCSTMPMQRATVAALRGDRSHQAAFRTALRERAALVHALIPCLFEKTASRMIREMHERIVSRAHAPNDAR